MGNILETHGLQKRFGTTQALAGVDPHLPGPVDEDVGHARVVEQRLQGAGRGPARHAHRPPTRAHPTPEVAALQAASRNSRLVSPGVMARALERSGSTTAVAAPAGRYSASDERGPATAGRSDSMPSTGMPSAIFSR